jgi:hypothetical protein
MPILSSQCNRIIFVVNTQSNCFIIILHITFIENSRHRQHLLWFPPATLLVQALSPQNDPEGPPNVVTIHRLPTIIHPLLQHPEPLTLLLQSILSSVSICPITQLYSTLPSPMILTGQISCSYPNPQLSDPYSHLHIRSQQLLRHLIDHQCLKSSRIFTVTTTFSICNPFYMYWTPSTLFILRWSTPSWRVVLDILFYLIVQWDGGIYLPSPIHPRCRCRWDHVLGNARSHSPVFDGFAPASNWGVLPPPTTMTGPPLPTIWARRIQTVPDPFTRDRHPLELLPLPWR